MFLAASDMILCLLLVYQYPVHCRYTYCNCWFWMLYLFILYFI